MIDINGKTYSQVRCAQCHKLIAYQQIYAGWLAYHCPRCGDLTEVEYKFYNNESNQLAMQKKFSVQ